jgi:S1-C subfamily serine protease
MKTITAISATLICSIVGIFGFVSGAKAAEASGSGFFITKNGYVATNHHVIEGAKDVKVKDASGSVWDAEVAFTDLANDLAILKVTGDGFKALSIRPSSAVMKGATVFTIGFPNTRIQGTEAKVTQGIVSSLSGITGEPNSFQISVPVVCAQPYLVDSVGVIQ